MTIVKFLQPIPQREYGTARYSRQLPTDMKWGDTQFTFNQHADEFDWCVVYQMPIRAMTKKEISKSILLVTEPNTILQYDLATIKQFTHVVSFQDIVADNVIVTNPGLIWWYGHQKSGQGDMTYEDLTQMSAPIKKKKVSVVQSRKIGADTLYFKRFVYVRELVKQLKLDVFGFQGIALDDKRECLDGYQYHIALENHFAPHHWTEKLSDAFLGYAVPFYYGCPNAEEYFPKDSFIRIDLENIDKSVDIITSTLKNNEYKQRVSAVKEARDLVLNKYNLFAVIDRVVTGAL